MEMVGDLVPVGATAGGSIVAYFAGAGPIASALIGPVVGAFVVVARYIRGAGPRAECEREIARAVRSILNRPLALTRIDGVGFGDFLTLRHLGATAREGRIRTLFGFGGPAHTLELVLLDLVAEVEDEVGRCYERLRPPGQKRIDAFAAALRRGATAAASMLYAVPPTSANGGDHRLEDLAAALDAIDRAGDGLDRAFDPDGFARAASDRATSSAELLRKQNHSAAVLHQSARHAADNLLQVLIAAENGAALGEPAKLAEAIEQARYWVLNVDAVAFREATDEARQVHRRITYDDLAHAGDAARRWAQGDPAAEAAVREHLARLREDVASLDAIRMRRDLERAVSR